MVTALVGTGKIAAQHLACLSTLEGVDVAAVCDLSAAAGAATAERFGVPQSFTDHREMLAQVRPDVVHVTTPAESHFAIACDALRSGAHVLVEKPVAGSHDELQELLDLARGAGRLVVEDHNYVWDPAIVRIRELAHAGALGEVRHVDVAIALDVFAAGSRYGDRAMAHPCLAHPAGVVSEFITHLTSLAHAFAGPANEVHAIWQRTGPDGQIGELRALIDGERATAAITFSATSRPSEFTVRISATGMRAAARLFDRRLTLTPRRSLPGALAGLVNDLGESAGTTHAALAALREKLAGDPGTYAGLWELVRRTYAALQSGSAPPVTHADVAEVNAMADAVLCTAPRAGALR